MMQRNPPNGQHDATEAAQAALVALFRAGDRQAFRRIYDLYEHPIYRFCKHLIGDEVLARDAFQECFVRIYEHRGELQTDNVRSWLFTIARRTCLNTLRAHKRQHDEFNEDFHSQPTHTEGDVFLRDHIDLAIRSLPITLREALILRDVEGYSYQEIAAIVGIDLSLAKVRVYRARIHMRKYLLPIVAEQRK